MYERSAAKDSNARLQHYNRDELMALIWDFLSDRDEDALAEFLDLMRQKSRPAALEPLVLQDADDLLGSIQELHDAIANDEYIQTIERRMYDTS